MSSSATPPCPVCGSSVPQTMGPHGLCPKCVAAGLLAPTQDEPSSPTVTVELPDALPEAPGARLQYLGDYELTEEIARGGMGIVYRARQVSLNRPVAVKLILTGELASKDFVQRFQTEAEAAATLDHPNIVPIHEIGVEGGRHYFSMKLIEGPPLSRRLKEGPLSPREAATLMAAVARAIHYAHQRGVLHRDIKPGNILLDVAGDPWLTDFGLAKLADRDSAITRTNALMGTPAYMAPEQARGNAKALTTAADIYSLGAVLYECLVGRPPLVGATPLETIRLVLEEEPERPTTLNPGLDLDLETICLRCLEKDPIRRYGSAEMVAEELERWLRGEPILARSVTRTERAAKWVRRHPAIAGFTAVLLLTALIGAAGIVYQWREAVHARRATEAEGYRAGIALAKSLLERGDRDGALSSLMSLPRRLRHWEWGWLMQQCHQDMLSLQPWASFSGMNGNPEFHRVAFSPDNRLLATWNENEVKLFRLSDGALERSFVITNMMHTPTTWTPPIPYDLWKGRRVTVVSFSADSRKLFVHGRYIIAFFDIATGECLVKAPEPFLKVDSLQTDPSGREIIGFALEPRIEPMALDADTLAVNWKIPSKTGMHPENPSTHPCVSRDGRYLVNRSRFEAGSFDRTIENGPESASLNQSPLLNIWDLERRARGEEPLLASITWPTNQWPVFWSVDDAAGHVATLDAVGTIRVRRLPGNEELWSHRFPENPDGTRAIDLLEAINRGPGGQWVLARQVGILGGPILHVFDLISGLEVARLPERVYRWEASPDGQFLATAAADRTACIWRLRDGKCLRTLRGHTEPIGDIRFSPDGRRVATVDFKGTIKLWPALPGRERFEVEINNFIQSGTFSPDGTLLATPHADRSVRIWDAASGQLIRSLLGHLQVVTCTAWSRDGRQLITGGWDKRVMVWDVETGRRTRVLTGPTKEVNQVFVTPEGQVGATSQEGALWVWDPATGGVAAGGRTNLGEGVTIAFSPDGRQLATVSSTTGLQIQDWRTHHVAPFGSNILGTALDWNPDGRSIAIGAIDGRLIFWSARNGKPMVSSPGRGSIRGIRFSPDGARLFVARSESMSDTGRPGLEVWNPADGRLLLVFDEHPTSYNPPSISSDGRRVFSGDDAGVSTVWEAFPWREEEYSAASEEELLPAMNDYAVKYWRQRLQAESATRTPEPASFQRYEPFPPRDPATPSRCLDLSSHFNFPLDVHFPFAPNTMALTINYSRMPVGLHVFTNRLSWFQEHNQMPCVGVPFDLRGVVALADRSRQRPGLERLFPVKAEGIVVGQKAAKLHFLHESTAERPSGDLGRYLVHYADATSTDISLRTNQRLGDASVPASEQDVSITGWRVFFSTSSVEIIWGSDDRAWDGGHGPFLHAFTWTNRHPEKVITSLDFESYLKGYHVFLLAVTAEAE